MRHDTPEFRLIAAALSGNTSLPGPNWDWDRTVEIAAREEVLPALRARLSSPPDVSDFFEGVHELNAERNLQLLCEVESLSVLFNQAGIEPVLLKGSAYLAAGVYSDPAGRWLQDIDLLVDRRQSSRAFEIIRSSGYEPGAPHPASLVHHHHYALTQVHRVPVEIHHSLGQGACGAILTGGEMVSSSKGLRLGSAAVRIPSPEHMAIHLILHSQLSHGVYCRIWPSLRTMLDLVLLRHRFSIDWDEIRRRFRGRGNTALLNLYLLQIEKTLGVPPPFPIPGGGFRWLYRRAMWREPRLRYVDPVYTVSRLLLPRIRLAWRLLGHPVGRRYVLSKPFRMSFYKGLLTELVRG